MAAIGDAVVELTEHGDRPMTATRTLLQGVRFGSPLMGSATNVITQAGDLRQGNCSEAEWTLRCRLAQAYHLIDYFGWTGTIFNPMSARLPGNQGHYLVNPFGLNYDDVTPANLLKIDLDGKLVEPSPYPANPAGFAPGSGTTISMGRN